ncbi:FtsK/SpoIIIE domain-containing protein [Streptomyces lasiicapitis]|uniref:Conjugal transfer protein TraS n=1 Tax=Streptomyces lasiicapitis TaxID=1923961 RepID=A0ABQ2LII1_9ACTN|nr:FtsK/SpoIIIE domain-containing protein [Streptomyces lasiicapitis]GGO35646.1 conjugal transfer protein TraS [Streptomyces lasiicapitis]
MGIPVGLWILVGLALVGWLARRWWEPCLAAHGLAPRDLPLRWWLVGYPAAAWRIVYTWRRLCMINNLSVSFRPNQRLISKDTVVQGQALKPRVPKISWPMPTRTGLRVRVLMHPGQTPAPYYAAARAMEHAWRVHGVRVTSPRRGHVLITVTAHDPLTGELPAAKPATRELLSADVGLVEDGLAWVIDFRRIPHWMITGATQSGKSTLLAALVRALTPQRVALVGIDCKGGMELGLFGSRLTKLASSRAEAIEVLERIIREIQERTRLCRTAGVRSIWDLPEDQRPVPVVLIVDELAELYLNDGSRTSRREAEECGTLLLRIAQLGAALGVHLVAAGQRVGSDLGPRVTALRAQLGGRVAHRAHDEASAEMTLGDINKDAVVVAQSITEEEQGVAVVAMQGRWSRARSHLITSEEIADIAATYPPLNPLLSGPENSETGMKGGRAE